MTPPRVMGIFAHPDDESILAGGTLAACAAAGSSVQVLSLTRGENGPPASDLGINPEQLATHREAELRHAARVLGIDGAQCLDFPDGELTWVDRTKLRSAIATRTSDHVPDIVLTFGPEGLYWHPDHLAVHMAVTDAVDDALSTDRQPDLYFATMPSTLMSSLARAASDRGLPSSIWSLNPDAFGVPATEITTVLDVSDYVARKLEAIRCHVSQLHPDHLFRNLPVDLADRFLAREYFVRSGSRVRAPDPLTAAIGHVTPGGHRASA